MKKKIDALEVLMGKGYVEEQRKKGIIPRRIYFKPMGADFEPIIVCKPIQIVGRGHDEEGYYLDYFRLTNN